MVPLAILMLAALVGFVVVPLLRPAAPALPDDEQLEARERRDRALAALRELEFDHRTGKIGDEDYAALRGPLSADAAEALQAVTARDP